MSKFPELNNKEWIENKYFKEKLSQQKIAVILGCSVPTIQKAFNRLGIKAKTLSEAQKDRVDHPLRGKHPSKETRKKMSEAHKGEKHPMFGKHHTKEAKQKMSLAKKGKSPWIKGKHLPKESVQKMAESLRGRQLSEEHKRKMAEAHKGEKNHFYGKKHSKESKEKMSISSKKRWNNPDFIHKWAKAVQVRPTKLENKLKEILREYFPKEWKYNGDFGCGISIGGQIPDFVNVNGKKAVIEVFGSIWHDPQEMKERLKTELPWKRTEFGKKAIYSQFGYKCIVFWENDLKRKDAKQFVTSELKRELNNL